MATTSTSTLPEQIIYLIIRFTASIPDLPLSISSPKTTTTLSLKRLIRSSLPPSHSASRLRLIYAGKVLADTAPLSTSLKLPPPPPPRNGTYNQHGAGSKSKSKQAVRDEPTAGDQSSAQKLYVHCSLGDDLSPADLAAEASAALTSETSLRRREAEATSKLRTHGRSLSESNVDATRSTADLNRRTSTSTAPTPQGFDRLLSAGFNASEVASLRSQFLTNLSFTHTPDNMPSATQIRLLEDQWLDSTAQDNGAATAAATDLGDSGWGAGFGVEDGGLDDMLFGYLTGFLWPLVAVVWGMREEGVWTRRRQVAVVMGLVLNCAFGFLRWSS